MAKSANWYKKYKIHSKPKPSKGFTHLCDLPIGSVFRIPSINYKGILLQTTEGGCFVVRKDAPKYSKMGELLGKEDRKEYISRRTEVNEFGKIENTDRFNRRKRTSKTNQEDSVGSRKDKRFLRMAKKRGKINR